MSKIVALVATAIWVLTLAMPTEVGAVPKAGSGAVRCKAPWGEIFAGGETIELHETDAHGNVQKVTYTCTENGWVKVARVQPRPPKVLQGPLNPLIAPSP